MPKEVRTALDVLAPYDKHEQVFDAFVQALRGEKDQHAMMPPDVPVITWAKAAYVAKLATSKYFV